MSNGKIKISSKNHNLYLPCKIYKGICSCEETYIGETICNVEEY